MSDAYITHVVSVPNERWDTVAYRYYGDANRTAPLIKANRAAFEIDLSPLAMILPIGTTLTVPVLAPDPVAADLLPPWKRGERGFGP